MKKLIFITLGLAALFGVTACVEPQNVSPTYNPVDNTINTQFVFNISAAAGESDPSTKQADTSVQANGNFRGIDNASLFGLIDSTVTTSTASAKRKMVQAFTATTYRDFSSILSQSAVPANQKGGTRIVEVNLPVGTNELVFYAKAAKQHISGLDDKELYGSLSYTTTSDKYMDLSEAIGSFAERRLADEDTTAFRIMKQLISGVLNGLFRTCITSETSTNWFDSTLANPTITYTNASHEVSSYTVNGRLYLADYQKAGSDDNPLSPLGTNMPASELEKILGKLFVSLSSNRYAVSAGSGSACARVLSDIYNIAKSGADATPTSIQEAVAQVMFKKIASSVEKFSDATTSLTGERTWKPVSTVRTYFGINTNAYDSYDLNEFPVNMHLPLGAVTLGAGSPILIGTSPTTIIPQIKYTTALDTLLHGSGQGIYTYMPELCYYGNSSIRTNNSNTLSNSSYPTDYTDWYGSDMWNGAGWEADGSAITNSTRGIALTNTIQYGVSLLCSKLVFTTTMGLTDNGLNMAGQTKSFTLDDTHYLEWTGILIGGQPEQVGWDYLLKKTNGAAAGMNAIVYDKVNYRLSEKNTGKDTCGIAINTKSSGEVWVGGTSKANSFTNYTLVYDNVDPYANTDDTQGDVYVALEFVNRLGQDFWGQEGLIRDGATFYLFAKLTPTPNLGGDEETFWTNVFKEGGYNNHYLLPPYNPNSGVSRPIRRVFVQDIKTGVDFRFGPTSLSNAYLSIPDLRSAKISLGMAVDLKWETGLNYEAALGER